MNLISKDFIGYYNYGGYILIEDLPGTGKTIFAESIMNSLNLDFKRIQFTSDLLPSDILGYTYIKK